MKDLKERGDDESRDGFEDTHIVRLEQDMIFNLGFFKIQQWR